MFVNFWKNTDEITFSWNVFNQKCFCCIHIKKKWLFMSHATKKKKKKHTYTHKRTNKQNKWSNAQLDVNKHVLFLNKFPCSKQLGKLNVLFKGCEFWCWHQRSKHKKTWFIFLNENINIMFDTFTARCWISCFLLLLSLVLLLCCFFFFVFSLTLTQAAKISINPITRKSSSFTILKGNTKITDNSKPIADPRIPWYARKI